MKICKLAQLFNKQFIAGLVVGIALSIMIIANEKQYAYVDMESVISSITKKLQHEKNIKEALQQHRSYFEKILNSYSKDHNTVIFTSLKPIAGARDLTDYFINEMTDFDFVQAP